MNHELRIEKIDENSFDVWFRGRRVGHVEHVSDNPRNPTHVWKAVPLNQESHAFPAGIGTGVSPEHAARWFLPDNDPDFPGH